MDVRAECFGVLVNSVDVRSSDFYYYAGGYGKQGYYGYSGNTEGSDYAPVLARVANEEKSL